jgi:hypothetical protein
LGINAGREVLRARIPRHPREQGQCVAGGADPTHVRIFVRPPIECASIDAAVDRDSHGHYSAQRSKPTTHRLEATPETVAYGYYWSEAKPVLRIASGDIIDVDTLLTNTPRGLERAGVKPEDVQASLRKVVDTVTDKGPGGHILTGPVFVEGAEPGDALEVRILSIDLSIPWLQRVQRVSEGKLLEQHEDHSPRQEEDDRAVRAGHRHSASSVLRQHGRCAAGRRRARQQHASGHSCR